MSQAELHPDSGANSSASVPDPGAVPPPPSGSIEVPPPPPTSAAPPSGPAASVPPPPPPRASLPPVRPATEAKAASGVGSAKGVRWRGELEGIGQDKKKKKVPTAAPAPGSAAEEEDEEEEVQLAKEAPPWLVSMVLHLVFLLILALISAPVRSGLGQLMLTVGNSEVKSPSEFEDFSLATEISLDDADALKESEVELDLTDVFEADVTNDAAEVEPMDLGVGEKIELAKPMFNGRTGAMKQALLAIYGGSPETQEAVARGLAWLARNQRRDGSWSMRGPYSDGALAENTTAATAMALLAFLGDGNTHMKGEYADQVNKGIKYLIGQQDRSGFFAKSARGHEKMYAQAQASIAICELYAMTKDSWLRPRAQLAIDYAEKAQSDEGGWRYEPNFDSDTSVTGWFVMALESGRAAGLNVDISVLTQVNEYLNTVSHYDDAAYAYQARGNPSPAMTAEGILCRQYISWNRDNPAMFRGIQALLEDALFDMSDRDVYYWYYATQIMHHFGGSPWREWNSEMRVQLPKAQVLGGREDGSWAPQQDRWGRNSGRLFTTCLSIFCLEVYYRHMPLYKAEGNQ